MIDDHTVEVRKSLPDSFSFGLSLLYKGRNAEGKRMVRKSKTVNEMMEDGG